MQALLLNYETEQRPNRMVYKKVVNHKNQKIWFTIEKHHENICNKQTFEAELEKMAVKHVSLILI